MSHGRNRGVRTAALLITMNALLVSAADNARQTRWKDCFASFDQGTMVLTVGNGLVERAWTLGAGDLLPTRLADRRGTVWHGPAATAAQSGWTVTMGPQRLLPVEAEALTVNLAYGDPVQSAYQVRVFAGVPAVEWRRTCRPGHPAPADAVIDVLALPADGSLVHGIVHLQDHTDAHKKDNLVRVDTHALGAAPFTGVGNVAYVENAKSGHGVVFVKLAPLPHARQSKVEKEFAWGGGCLEWRGPGVNAESGRGYPCATVVYRDGRAGRIAALQDYYRCLRRYQPGRDGLLLSNTWGDRSRDAKISQAFMLAEVKAGHALGIDVVEIDDGWQKGTTQNSASVTRSKEGVWSGFWRTDPAFWTAHPGRLPNGLRPVADAAEKAGLAMGLWYAPDSDNAFENWKRDADRILALYHELGVRYFKLDSITMTTPRSEWNVQQMLERVICESAGEIVVDLDVTAGVRPGYLGAVSSGTVFVENRYSDWGSYWPHLTLRNFWSLAQYVDPVRLRMEFLNNARNVKKYGDNPLAPATYPPAYLFAAVMFGSPLAWFEVSELPAAYAREVGALVTVWRAHRDALHAGQVIPFGAEPDGHQWTGFASIARDRRSGYLLVLREVNETSEQVLDVPLIAAADADVTVLAGSGRATLAGGKLKVSLPQARSFVFLRFDCK